MKEKGRDTERLKRTDALVLQAKSGDEKAFSDLLEAYSPLLDAEARRFSVGLPDEEYNDLRQEAAIAFCRALDQFDPAKGVAFGYFAKGCIRNRLIDYTRRMKEPPVDGDTFPQPEPDDPGRDLLEKEKFLSLCKRIREILSDYENCIWTLVISGQTASGIAKTLGIDRKSVENALARVRRKLKKELPPR